MRVIAVTIGTLLVVLLCLMTAKFWGKSQHYVEYKHPFFFKESSVTEPVLFIKPSFEKLMMILEGSENLYLDVAFTSDQILVLPKQKLEKAIRFYSLSDIQDKVISIETLASYLKPGRKIIFNLLENTRAVHEVFIENMKKINFAKGDNYLVTSEYEAPIRALKELEPALLFGTTKPEILKLVAMESMYLLEAATLRADVLIHPLKIKNQKFYSEVMLNEMNRRHKKIIVGPIHHEDMITAQQLHTYGIIVNE